MRAHESALFCLVNIKTDPAGLSCTANKKKKKGDFTVLNIDISLSIVSTTTAEKSRKPFLIPVESSAADKDGCKMLLRARYMFLSFSSQNSKHRN